MKNKDPFKHGFIFIEQPYPFKHRQLSSHKQKKDINIKHKKDQLEKKTQEHLLLQRKYLNAHDQLKKYEQNRKKQTIELQLRQQKLKNQLFKLSIRRDQIQSRINFSITLQKANTIKKYLRCITYTASNKLDLIKFWRSQRTYNCLNFLLKFILNRFFREQHVQCTILRNLSRIVYCKKIYFQSQWIMVVLKEQITNSATQETQSGITSNQRTRHYLMSIYAITGKYFSIEKKYDSYEIKKFSQNPFLVERNNHRLSVADNIKNQLTRFHQIDRSNKEKSQIDLLSSQYSSKSKNTFLQFKSSNLDLTENNDKDDHGNFKNEHNSQIYQDSNCNEQSDSSEDLQNFDDSSNENKTVRSKNKQNISTSKTNFSIKLKNCFKMNASKINYHHQQLYIKLFPYSNPLLNLIILKDHSQAYFLQEYVRIKQKKLILQKAIARFKLKYKLAIQNKKNLYYKVIYIDKFYQNLLGDEQYMNLGFLLKLKCYQSLQYAEIYLLCDSINFHHRLKKAISLKILIHKQAIYKDEVKEQFSSGKKNPNVKILKTSSIKKGRQSKRGSGIKNSKNANLIQRTNLIQAAYKAYMQNCKLNPQKMIQKLHHFLQNNYISIEKGQFIDRKQIHNAIYKIIRVQNKIKCVLCKDRYKIKKAFIKSKINFNQKTKILITVNIMKQEDIMKIFVQNLSPLGQYKLLKADQMAIHQELIFGIIQKYQNNKNLEDTFQDLNKIIKIKIQEKIQKIAQKQREKPQKNRRTLKRFFHMLNLRQKVKKNIFFIKKITIKQNKFVLILRRDRFLRNILECTLTDIYPQNQTPISDSITKPINNHIVTKDSNNKSEEISNISSHHSSKKKYHKYQKIYLMEQYFKGFDDNKIINQFYIDKGIFILKPSKSYNAYFIQRLACININSQEFTKQLAQRMEQNDVRNSKLTAYSNKSLKKIKKKGQNNPLLNTIYSNNNKAMTSSKKNDKKTSIDLNESYNDILNYVKNTFLKDTKLSNNMHSKKSVTDILHKGKYYYKIFQNYEQQYIYYSFYKEDNIFFIIDYFTIKRTKQGSKTSEELFKIHSQTVQKQQLTQNIIFVKKLASWMYENNKLQRKESKYTQSQNNFFTNDVNSITLEYIVGFAQNSQKSQFSNNAHQYKGIASQKSGIIEHSETDVIHINLPITQSDLCLVSSKLDVSNAISCLDSIINPHSGNQNILLSLFQ